MKKTGYKVLVVDDESNICSALQRILREEGYLVKAVSDGNVALDVLSKKRTDVVLLDLMMPGINGREICAMARHIAVDTRVIYFTAFVESKVTSMRELMGEADGFIRKPASVKRILSELNAVLSSPMKIKLSNRKNTLESDHLTEGNYGAKLSLARS